MKNLHLMIVAGALILAGLGLGWYKTSYIGLPLTSATQAEVWTVEARVRFEADGGSVKAEFFIPNAIPNFAVLDEDFASGNYGLTLEDSGANRLATWAVRSASGTQSLYYRLRLYNDESTADERNLPAPPFPEIPDYPDPQRSAIMALLDDVRASSADVVTFSRGLLKLFSTENPDANVRLLTGDEETGADRVRTLIYVLAGARIPARMVSVLELEDGLREGRLKHWLEVHNGREWVIFNPATAERGLPDNALIWRVNDEPLIQVSGGGPAEVEFAAARNQQDLLAVAQERAERLESWVMDFSLYSLPLQTQNVYRILLMIPIGALLVVFVRNVIGFKTFGTFMPILMALAFRETQLAWGIALFTFIVALGLMLRFYLENLKLLLVPRLASVLTIVILLMAVVTVLTHKLGLERGLSVALFPMVILAMTIERMSVVWEEAGPSEALQQGIGSLIVAALGYLLMNNDTLTHLVFVFPELLLVVLAITLMLGRYTGYRLTELWRFRSALGDSGAP